MSEEKDIKRFEKVTKEDLIRLIKKKDDRIQDYIVRRVLNLEHEIFVESLRQGKEVQIKDHITVYPYARKEQIRYNPPKQKSMVVPSKVVTKVELGGELKKATKDLDYEKIRHYKKAF